MISNWKCRFGGLKVFDGDIKLKDVFSVKALRSYFFFNVTRNIFFYFVFNPERGLRRYRRFGNPFKGSLFTTTAICIMSGFYEQRGKKSERMQVSDVERNNIRVLSAGTIPRLQFEGGFSCSSFHPPPDGNRLALSIRAALRTCIFRGKQFTYRCAYQWTHLSR